MRKLALVGAILGAMFLASPAGAVTLVYPNGAPLGVTNIWQRWANEAKVPTVDGVVTFSTDRRLIALVCSQADQAYAGCETEWMTQQGSGPWMMEGHPFIGIPDRPRCDNDQSFRACYLGTFYHELGHAFDAVMLTDAERATFMAIFPRRVRCGWCESTRDVWGYNFPGIDAVDRNGPYIEWWAENYRLCAQFGAAWRPDRIGEAPDGVLYGDPEQRMNWALWARRRGPRVRRIVRRLEALQARVCALVRSAASHGPETMMVPGSVTPGLAR